MISEEAKHKLILSISKEKEATIEELKKIFSYQYTEETRLIFLDAETFAFGLGWQALPHSNVTDEVPLYYENGKPIYDCIASASCGFDKHLDYNYLRRNDDIDKYFIVGKKVFAQWLSDIYHELNSKYNFYLPILLGFREDLLIYNLKTGEFKEEDEWEEELFDE